MPSAPWPRRSPRSTPDSCASVTSTLLRWARAEDFSLCAWRKRNACECARVAGAMRQCAELLLSRKCCLFLMTAHLQALERLRQKKIAKDQALDMIMDFLQSELRPKIH